MLDLAYGAAILVLSAIGNLTGSWLSSYFKKKGENRAGLEDLKALTAIVEGVKSEFEKAAKDLEHGRNVFLEQTKEAHSLRVLAAERRLQALQEAYGLWHELLAGRGKTEIYARAHQWWLGNSLYLDAEPRRSFAKAMTSWRAREIFSAHIGVPTEAPGREAFEGLKRAHAAISDAGDMIVRAAGLPPLAGGEVSQSSGEPEGIWDTAVGIPLGEL